MKKPLNLNEWAYQTIKMRILENDIRPGSQLNIEELSKELEISRTPIREALLRLRQNGFVVSFSNVGFFVCGISKEDFEDAFELRKLIESYAIVKFVERSTDVEMRILVGIHEKCKLMAAQGDAKAFNEYDIRLHDLIIDCLGNKKMKLIYDNLADLLYRLRVYALKSSENITQSVVEHDRIILAIESKDAALAYQAMEQHIVNVKNRLSQIVEFEGM